jgi:isopentenyl-diphosphate delta-isomerase type 2
MGIVSTNSKMADSSRGHIGQRKAEHLEICVDETNYDVENGSTMFDEVRLVHRALPEINTADVNTGTEFLSATIRAPLFISSMTGGSAEAFKRNKDLARVAQETGIPVGMGSIRILFRNPEVIHQFELKKIARDVPVFANIGGVQLPGIDSAKLVELLKRLEVDAVAVHLNPGQELAQPEGDRNFKGVLDGIRTFCDTCPVPVIVKETGAGIAPDEAARIIEAGARYVDIAGSGGTNWMTVEGFRLPVHQKDIIDEFEGWGIPTAAALGAFQHAGKDFGDRVLASGGLRTGMHVAKAVALGATAAGMALPFIRSVATDGVDGGVKFAERVIGVLKNVMVLTGCTSTEELRQLPVITTPAFDAAATGLGGQHRI